MIQRIDHHIHFLHYWRNFDLIPCLGDDVGCTLLDAALFLFFRVRAGDELKSDVVDDALIEVEMVEYAMRFERHSVDGVRGVNSESMIAIGLLVLCVGIATSLNDLGERVFLKER